MIPLHLHQRPSLWLSQATVPHLIKAQGAIVNVASTASIEGYAYLGHYCASKGALLQLTKAMAMEFIERPSRISAVYPGGMATEMVSGMQISPDFNMKKIERYMPPRGMHEASEIAEMIVFLDDNAQRNRRFLVRVDPFDSETTWDDPTCLSVPTELSQVWRDTIGYGASTTATIPIVVESRKRSSYYD